MAERTHPNEKYVENLFNDAINWLGVVGEYDHNIPKEDNPYNRSVDKALNFLASQIAESSIDIAMLLSTLERQAQTVVAESDDLYGDLDRVIRTNQMYVLARTMNAYSSPERIVHIPLEV
ncbi:MAG TPA: hypothetical protein VFT49_01450 [Candidatus Saccharimonadales bacterium]|nr:hypothetical protein [Candidatus Saccharimonadales bacterium]